MPRTLTATLASAGLLFGALLGAACGDDDGGGGSGARADVADQTIEAMKDAGVTVDEDCVRDAADQLSDEDAEAIASAGVDGDPEISAEAEAVGESLLECVDLGDAVDELLDDGDDAGSGSGE